VITGDISPEVSLAPPPASGQDPSGPAPSGPAPSGPAPLSLSPRADPRGQRRRTRRSSILLFDVGTAESFRSRWLDIQTSFVDEPERSVEQADLLVAEVLRKLAKSFTEKRAKLEPQLVKGEEISTEELRIALRHYRSFFDRLLLV
jgi:hypothetical protein